MQTSEKIIDLCAKQIYEKDIVCLFVSLFFLQIKKKEISHTVTGNQRKQSSK